MIFLVLLFLVMVTVLLYLYRSAVTASRLQTDQQQTSMGLLTEIQSTLLSNQLASHESAARSQQETFRQMVATTISELDRQQTLTQKSMDLSLTRALDGSNKQMERMASTLQSALTMLGTKDPIAYQQVYAPTANESSDDGRPYTATDEVVEEQLRQAEAERVNIMLAQLGSLGNGTFDGAAAGSTDPYPFPAEQ